MKWMFFLLWMRFSHGWKYIDKIVIHRPILIRAIDIGCANGESTVFLQKILKSKYQPSCFFTMDIF